MLKNCIPFLPVLKKHQKRRFRYIFPFRRKPAQKTLSKRRKKKFRNKKQDLTQNSLLFFRKILPSHRKSCPEYLDRVAIHPIDLVHRYRIRTVYAQESIRRQSCRKIGQSIVNQKTPLFTNDPYIILHTFCIGNLLQRKAHVPLVHLYKDKIAGIPSRGTLLVFIRLTQGQLTAQPLHTEGQTFFRAGHHQVIHHACHTITLRCSLAVARQDDQKRHRSFLRPQEQRYSRSQSDLAVQKDDLCRLLLQMLQQSAQCVVVTRYLKIGQLGKHFPQGICTGYVGRKDQYIFHCSPPAFERPSSKNTIFRQRYPSFAPNGKLQPDFYRSICRSRDIFCHK